MAMPDLMLGRNVSFNVYIGSDTAGTITWLAAVPLAGKAERAEHRLRRETELIVALDDTLAHYVPLMDDWVLVLSAIKRKAGTNPNPLQALFLGAATPPAVAGFGKIVVSTSANTFTYEGVVQELTITHERGKNTDAIVLIPVNNGAANPLVA